MHLNLASTIARQILIPQIFETLKYKRHVRLLRMQMESTEVENAVRGSWLPRLPVYLEKRWFGIDDMIQSSTYSTCYKCLCTENFNHQENIVS